MPSTPSLPPVVPPTRASVAPELRRHLLRMVLGVVVLDVAVLALKSRLHVDGWPSQRRLLFTGAWMIATLVIVALSLARIRAARLRARYARSGRVG